MQVHDHVEQHTDTQILALGILSSAQEKLVAQRFGETTGRFARRRHVIRTSWLQPTVVFNASIRAHFVLRCGGLAPATVAAIATENASASDLLCASVPASDGRVRGPLLALWWWLRYAYHAYPHAQFVGKADDDVFVHLPDAEQLLRAIPPSLAPNALLGVIMYFQLTTFPNDRRIASPYEIHSFGSTAQHSRNHKTPAALRCDAELEDAGALVTGGKNGTTRSFTSSTSTSSDTSSTSTSSGPSSLVARPSGTAPPGGKRCYGPFPLPCGPFWAIGRGVLRALTRADSQVAEDLATIRALPSSNHRILDDVWLGSILWRFVGGALPVALFTIDARGPLFYDRADRFRARASLAALQNRERSTRTSGHAWDMHTCIGTRTRLFALVLHVVPSSM